MKKLKTLLLALITSITFVPSAAATEDTMSEIPGFWKSISFGAETGSFPVGFLIIVALIAILAFVVVAIVTAGVLNGTKVTGAAPTMGTAKSADMAE